MPRLLSFLAAVAALFMSAILAAQAGGAEFKTPPPPPPPDSANIWNLDLSTGGRVVIQLRPDAAPNTVARIKTLTSQGFYNGLAFFRVIEGFMAQTGDPQNSGIGGSTLPNLAAEINGLPHVRGALGMARAQDLNSANSQFYIMFSPHLQMDRQYTVFGRVVGGMSYVDAIERGEPPAAPSRIVRASLGTDNLPPMTAEQLQAEAARMAAAQAPIAAGHNAAVGPAEPPPVAGPRPLEPIRAPGAPPRPHRPRPSQ